MCFIVTLDHLCRAVGHHHHTLSEQEKTLWDRETTNKKNGWKVSFSVWWWGENWCALSNCNTFWYVLIHHTLEFLHDTRLACLKRQPRLDVALWQMDKCKKTPQQIRMEFQKLVQALCEDATPSNGHLSSEILSTTSSHSYTTHLQ